jgi:RimJ/RimL family protein N-acetyltransferase
LTIRDRIHGRLVSLAPLTIQSAPLWARWMSDPDTTRYLFTTGQPPTRPFTVDDEREWGRRALADPRRVLFAIEDRDTGQTIGHARLTPLRGRRASFGIVIGEREHRGRGRGREATELVCRYGFDRMHLREIRLDVDPRNERAIRAYLAVGFQHARRGTMRRLADAR